jgi:NAD-dependent deacetylase
MSSLLDEATWFIKNAKHLTVFTGAGISVESGIPPFRGESGIWDKYDPSILELSRYLYSPQEVWPVIKQLFFDFFTDAKPNEAHKVIAKWESAGIVKAVITQNIDNLHQAAGSKEVIEFHGNSNFFECTSDKNHLFPVKDIDFNKRIPECPECGQLTKPSFIFFGEQIPVKAYRKSEFHARESDVMIVIGSTGEVIPAANVPWDAKRRGAKIIEINPENSAFTKAITDLYLTGKASDILKELDLRLNE